ncbi:MAG: hypothetical protein MJ154_03140 [Candidatus Saccharibacteria bacterium]|nr:hypothetical protein [Candidatus Saccharibacteria bacterium]
MQNCQPASIQEIKNYSNLLPVREYVDDLVKNCFALYDSFSKTIQEDEARNEQLKFDYREYNFHHSYAADCSVHVYRKAGGSNDYKTYDAFSMALNSGNIRAVRTFTLRLNMSFRRGKNNALDDHDHVFEIKMTPDGSTFSYEANYNDPVMNDIRDKLIEKIEGFPATTTIFSELN